MIPLEPKLSKYVPLTTTTTTTMTAKQQAKYRYGGVRYQLQGTDSNGTSWMVPEIEGLYGFPAEDEDK